MKRAFTVTIENGSKLGKAVIMAKSREDAATQALAAAPAGFRVSRILDNSREQRGFVVGPKGPRCALGGMADQGNTFKGSSRSQLWVGKRKS